VDTLFRHFLDPAPVPGTWIDHVDADARPRVDKIPASTLYHVFLAFAELMRVAPGSTR
jgi:mannose/cellobiose epimerase-like protein (N-acyl-D-glucosamine 2-epimerase family)